MARGVYLIGSKCDERVRAVQIVDCVGNSTTLRLKDYVSRKIQPEYKVLPWQQDVAIESANEKSNSWDALASHQRASARNVIASAALALTMTRERDLIMAGLNFTAADVSRLLRCNVVHSSAN